MPALFVSMIFLLLKFELPLGVYHRNDGVLSLYSELHPAMIAALASRESRVGLALNKTGYGDFGKAYGIMQVYLYLCCLSHHLCFDIYKHTPVTTVMSYGKTGVCYD